jgi:hypothetical protein
MNRKLRLRTGNKTQALLDFLANDAGIRKIS